MEVNNTFTSLIADLPYPANKNKAVQHNKPSETTTSQLADKEEQPSSTKSKTTANETPTNINILV